MKYTRCIVNLVLLLVSYSFQLNAQVNKDFDWHYLENMEYENGVLSPAFGMDPNGWYTAGANSKLESDEYGDVYFQSVGANVDHYFGLAERNFQERNQEAEYALRFTSGGYVMIYIHGVSQGYYGSFDETTKFKISKKTDGVYFYKQLTSDPDYVLMDSVLVSSPKGLWPYTIMRGDAYGFKNMSTNFPDTHYPVMWDSHETAEASFIKDNTGDLHFITVTDQNWKGKGVLSVQHLNLGEEGSITIPKDELGNGEFMLGVSKAESIDNEYDIKYGFKIDDSNNLKVFCNNVEEHSVVVNPSNDDKARMIFQTNQLLFFYGDSLLHTESINSSSESYRIALLFENTNQKVQDITTSVSFESPRWEIESNVDYIDEPYSFYKDDADAVGWTTGMASSGISYGNEKEVWLESVFIDDKIKFFGFTRDGSIPNSYTDFYFGMQLSNSGKNVEAYEIDDQGQANRLRVNMSNWDQYETYGYKLKMQLKNDSIRFFANDIHLSSHPLSSQHPLMSKIVYCGAMIYSPGGEIRDLRYGTEEIQEWHRPVDWYIADGVDLNKSKWEKESNLTSGWGNSVLVSRTQEHSQEDFRLEFNDIYDSGSVAFGITSDDYPTALSDIDFGFEIDDQNVLSVYSAGNDEHTFGAISAADKCWIEFDGSYVMFGHNDTYIWGKTVSSPVDFNIFQLLKNNTAHAVSAKTSARSKLEEAYFWEPSDYLYSAGKWQSRNTTAGMISSNHIKEGDDGFISFDNIESTGAVYMGISNNHDISKISDINYGFYKSDTIIRVIERGVVKVDLPTLNSFDELHIEKIGNTVHYYKNNLQLYSSELNSDYNWYVGYFTPTDQTNVPDGSVSFLSAEPNWTPSENLVHTSITKSLTQIELENDDQGIVASQLPYDSDHDHYLEFRVNGTQNGTTEKMSVGYILKADYDSLTDVSSDSLLVELRFSNKAILYAKGDSIYDFGAYAASDVFRLEKKAGVLSASLNGATPVVSPGVVCCSFYPIVQGLDVDAGVSTVSEPITTSPGYSTVEDGYAVPKRKLDGAVHLAKGKLFFYYQEHYDVTDLSDLQYKIFDKKNEELYDGCMPVQATALGDNHFVIDFTADAIDTCAPELEVDGGSFYVLEITNRKGHKRYVRFQYKVPFTTLPD